MSKRAHLHNLARELRQYLKWQRAQGRTHFTPATDEDRQRLQARKKALQEKQLQKLRSQFSDGDDEQSNQRQPEQPKSDERQSSSSAPEKKSPQMPSFQPAESDQKESSSEQSSSEEQTDKQEESDGVTASTPLWKQHDPIREMTAKKRQSKKKPKQSDSAQSGSGQSSGGDRRPGPPPPGARRAGQSGGQRRGGGRQNGGQRRGGGRQNGGRQDGGRQRPDNRSDNPKRSRSSQPRNQSRNQPGSNKSDKPQTPEEKMDFLREYLGDCQRCPLHQGRTNLVFGDGDPTARLMFIGEGPGGQEDRQGLPFVGPSGQLLTKMIKAMGLERDQVYITNVVKCRPPQNRDPAPLEIKECSPFLKKQVQVIEPEVIVTLGKFASNTLLQKSEAMGRMRGRWHEHMGIAVMPTYHPAYLLHNDGDVKYKRQSWNDLQLVMERLGLG